MSAGTDFRMQAVRTFAREFLLFGIKQASACIFGAYLLLLIMVTRWWFPFEHIHRNDFLFMAAVAFQCLLLATRLESPREAFVILVFHVVATVMEVFKTSDAIGAWKYPGEFVIGIGNVPLFAGFMYSAVGSYIARVWRIFDFRFTRYPPMWSTCLLVSLIYVNFFSHHFITDIRYALLAAAMLMFGRSMICFRIDQVHRRMPLVVGWFLVSLFIWIAENIATYSRVWIYPSQADQWQPVSPSKLVAWYLLMLLSFVLVSLVNRPRLMTGQQAARQSDSPLCSVDSEASGVVVSVCSELES